MIKFTRSAFDYLHFALCAISNKIPQILHGTVRKPKNDLVEIQGCGFDTHRNCFKLFTLLHSEFK